MLITILIIVFLLLVLILFYHQIPMYISSILLVVFTLSVGIVFYNAIFPAILLALLLIPFTLRPIRKQLFTSRLLQLFNKAKPSVSSTEQDALDAGTIWWESEFFKGKPNWRKLHNFPVPKLTKEEHAFLEGPVAEVCKMANDFQITHELADLPENIWAFLKQHRFFAMIIQKKYGGLEFSAYAQARVLQKLSGVSTILSITVGVPNSLGPGELLQHYGTTEQKEHYLPRLAKGDEIPCFALTSPEAGSDAAAIPDTGIICKGTWQGKEIVGIKLNWSKRYITLAPISTVIGLAFRLYDPQKLIGQTEDIGITCALIPSDLPGIEIGKRHFPLNVPFQNGPIRGKNVFIPLEYIIGGTKMAGEGWKMLMECLATGRGITLPSNTTGILKSISIAIGAYSHIRRQFKIPIGKMEGIEAPLAHIGGNAYLMDSAATLITTGIMLGEKPAILSAIVKYHCTQRGQQAIIRAMDIVAGKGICLGPTNFLARAYQGAPISITVEGANILTRSMIIFGQGALRCHPYLLPELKAAQKNNLNAFDKVIFSHIGYTISHAVRSLWLGITNGKTSQYWIKDETACYYQHINKLCANFILLSDCSIALLGSNLKRRERLSARLGDILSQLYLSSSVLKRYDDEGRQKADLPLVHWAIRDSLFQAQTAIDKLLYNFPNKWLGCVLKFLIYPFGRRITPPNDGLEHQVAQILQTPSETRNRLARGQFLTPCPNNPIGLLNQALDDILAAEPIYKRLNDMFDHKLSFTQLDLLAKEQFKAGNINVQEAEILTKAEQSRLYSITVDEFRSEDLGIKAKNKH